MVDIFLAQKNNRYAFDDPESVSLISILLLPIKNVSTFNNMNFFLGPSSIFGLSTAKSTSSTDIESQSLPHSAIELDTESIIPQTIPIGGQGYEEKNNSRLNFSSVGYETRINIAPLGVSTRHNLNGRETHISSKTLKDLRSMRD